MKRVSMKEEEEVEEGKIVADDHNDIITAADKQSFAEIGNDDDSNKRKANELTQRPGLLAQRRRLEKQKVQVNDVSTSTSISTATHGNDDVVVPINIWELPEVLVYHIACYVTPVTKRSYVLIHQIALLCKSACQSILLDESRSAVIWDLVLQGDYGITPNTIGGISFGSVDRGGVGNTVATTRRCCKRLRRSPVNRVRDAQDLIRKNTEIAYYYLWELAYQKPAKSKKTKNGSGMTKSKLCNILDEYGPNLLLNENVSSGSNFLVEICRSRYTTQHNILQCIQLLIERYNFSTSNIDLQTSESNNGTCQLTALCVASTRGMPNIVKYLLNSNNNQGGRGRGRGGASPFTKCSGKFRLYKNPKKCIKCINATPLQFAQTMLAEEQKHGATNAEVNNLKLCIKLLKEKEQEAMLLQK